MSNITASAATSGKCGDNLTWTYNTSTYTLTISGTGEMYDYESDNRPWESYEDKIKTVIINDGVTTIGDRAFAWYTGLTNIIIPDSVTTIGEWAFAWCTGLTSVSIPDSVTKIEKSAFYGCTRITSITIPDSITIIDDETFGWCTRLTSVIIPDSVTTIGELAFYNCTSLTSITIPDSVTTIGDYAFIDCSNLTDVFYGGTEAQWKKISIGSYNEDLTDATIHYKECEHKYNAVVTPPTCTEQGYTTYTCECGDSYVDDYVDATDHADNDGDGYCDADNELLDPSVECECNCHKSGISKFFFNFILFFQKIFGSNKTCSCGVAHY